MFCTVMFTHYYLLALIMAAELEGVTPSPLKAWLEDNFDHKVAVDIADPHLETLRELEEKGLAEIRVFDGVGAEKFAEHAFNFADKLIREATDNRCYCVKVECAEHGANSAIYEG